MALTEETVVDKAEVVGEYRHVQVRWEKYMPKKSPGGQEYLERTFYRAVYSPGDDVSALPQWVQDIAAAAWDQATLDAWAAREEVA